LSQFLYQTRKLDLPGIGSFTLDPTAVIPQEADRLGQMPASGIQFKNANILVPDDALLNFIKEHTGKMKSLVSADLDFFLTTGRQLLNIGKVFYIEGIGTLVKTKDKGLEFTPGDYLIARLEDSSPERRVSYDEPARDHREPKGNSTSTRQTLLLVGIILGLIIIGWGGYYLYRRNNFVEPTPEKSAVVIPDSTARTDSNSLAGHSSDSTAAAGATGTAASKGAAQPETPKTVTPPPVTPPATNPSRATADNIPVPPGASIYHFVILSTGNKYHALRRYNQLLGFQLNIRMDQKDSAWFKLYFPIAATARDTTHIKDSLSDVYAAPHVIIEH
jgi:hypothetical protein